MKVDGDDKSPFLVAESVVVGEEEPPMCIDLWGLTVVLLGAEVHPICCLFVVGI